MAVMPRRRSANRRPAPVLENLFVQPAEMLSKGADPPAPAEPLDAEDVGRTRWARATTSQALNAFRAIRWPVGGIDSAAGAGHWWWTRWAPTTHADDAQPYTAGISSGRRARWRAAGSACATTRCPSRRCFEGLPGRAGWEFAAWPEDTTEENIQARIRGTLLMALSNKFGNDRPPATKRDGHRLLHACTATWRLRGDRDVAKTTAWSGWRNAQHEFGFTGHPDPRTHHHAPAQAELRGDQTDQELPAPVRGAGTHHGALHGWKQPVGAEILAAAFRSR